MKVGLHGIKTAGHFPVEAHMDIAVGIGGQGFCADKHRVNIKVIIRVVVDNNVGGIALQDDVGGGGQSFVLIGDVELGTLADRELPV